MLKIYPKASKKLQFTSICSDNHGGFVTPSDHCAMQVFHFFSLRLHLIDGKFGNVETSHLNVSSFVLYVFSQSLFIGSSLESCAHQEFWQLLKCILILKCLKAFIIKFLQHLFRTKLVKPFSKSHFGSMVFFWKNCPLCKPHITRKWEIFCNIGYREAFFSAVNMPSMHVDCCRIIAYRAQWKFYPFKA